MTDERQPTEEELRARLEEEMRRIRVEDVLTQSAVTLVNLAGRKLGLGSDDPAERDRGQAKLAIDGARALAPLLEEEPARAVRDALSQLQLAYAREAQAPAGEPGPSEEEAERQKARSRIWTPPGT